MDRVRAPFDSTAGALRIAGVEQRVAEIDLRIEEARIQRRRQAQPGDGVGEPAVLPKRYAEQVLRQRGAGMRGTRAFRSGERNVRPARREREHRVSAQRIVMVRIVLQQALQQRGGFRQPALRLRADRRLEPALEVGP